jgi:hypothetical protein
MGSRCSLTNRSAARRFADGVTIFGTATPLIAAFSRARSAYMRLSFAFSASSSLIRFSSFTETPPYFERQLK